MSLYERQFIDQCPACAQCAALEAANIRLSIRCVVLEQALRSEAEFLEGEAKKTDSCYTCYTELAAAIAVRLRAALTPEVKP